jgi:LAS superfamily LD-carboxypeptidase LdcB
VILTAWLWLLDTPAASQEELNDALSRVDTLGLVSPSPIELTDLRDQARPSEAIDPWSAGSSAAEAWAMATAQNLTAQQTELVRLDLEANAAAGRSEVSGWHYAAATNRERVVADRLTALVVDSFVNGESDELDKLTGSQARTYIDAPIESATETLSAARERLESTAVRAATVLEDREETRGRVRARVRVQEYTVDEAQQLDSHSRQMALEHPLSLRVRREQTLEVSGDAPVTVMVQGFLVSPTIADPLRNLLSAAAEEGVLLGGWGYRSTAEQIQLRINHCGETGFAIFDGRSPNCDPPTARPLHSQHELGLAIDFTEDGEILSAASPGFLWLQENAAAFGFFNLRTEPWHWSTTGH